MAQVEDGRRLVAERSELLETEAYHREGKLRAEIQELDEALAKSTAEVESLKLEHDNSRAHLEKSEIERLFLKRAAEQLRSEKVARRLGVVSLMCVDLGIHCGGDTSTEGGI
jgi:hypothetical protein